jgi:hypothetical protein
MSMRQWASLCNAAGINVRNLELIDVYLIAGKILNDEVLGKRTVAEHLNHAVLPAGSRETVLLDDRGRTRRTARKSFAEEVVTRFSSPRTSRNTA